MKDVQEVSTGRKVWENVQLLALALTIAGQIVVGPSYIIGQALWFTANLVSVVRNFMLHRPVADKVKDTALLALTAGLIVAYLL